MSKIIVYNGINSVVEALLYYKNMACGKNAAMFANTMKAKYPESTEEITELFAPIAELEGYLNEISEGADMERIHFFFDPLGGTESTSHRVNIANAILLPLSCDETPMENFREYVNGLKALDADARLNKLHLSILLDNESGSLNDKPGIANYFDQVAAFPANEADKLKLLFAARYFEEYAEELYELVSPAAKLIDSRRELYRPLLERFVKTYDGVDESGLAALVSDFRSFNFDVPGVDAYMLCPRLFNITGITSTILPSADENMVNRFEVHALVDRILAYRNRDMSLKGIAECVKALGNPTRLEIMSMLRNAEVHAQGLVDKLGLSFTAVANHMNKLMLAGLVIGERRGNFVYYRASAEGIRWLIDKLRALLPEE